MNLNPSGTPEMTDDEKAEFEHVVRRTMAVFGRNGKPDATNLETAQNVAAGIIRQYRLAAEASKENMVLKPGEGPTL